MANDRFFVGYYGDGEIHGQGFATRAEASHGSMFSPMGTNFSEPWRYRSDTGELFLWIGDDPKAGPAITAWLAHKGYAVKNVISGIDDDAYEEYGTFHRAHGYYHGGEPNERGEPPPGDKMFDPGYFGRRAAIGDSVARQAIDGLFEDTALERRKWADRNRQYRRTGRSKWKTGDKTKKPTPTPTDSTRTPTATATDTPYYGDDDDDDDDDNATTPDCIYNEADGETVTFILNHDGGGAASANCIHRDLRRRADNLRDDRVKFIGDGDGTDVGDGTDRDSYVEGRAGRYNGAYTIAFWNSLNDAESFIKSAIDLCCDVNGDLPTDTSQWHVSTSDWEGDYTELNRAESPDRNPEFLKQDEKRRIQVELARQLHMASPDVKAAMGIKPNYVKKGPGLPTRQVAMASESVTESYAGSAVTNFWMDRSGNMSQAESGHLSAACDYQGIEIEDDPDNLSQMEAAYDGMYSRGFVRVVFDHGPGNIDVDAGDRGLSHAQKDALINAAMERGWTLNEVKYPTSGGRIEQLIFEPEHAMSEGHADTAAEWVDMPAIRMPNGEVFSNYPETCHYQLRNLVKAGREEGSTDDSQDGFVTNLGRFLTRREAFVLARNSGQISKTHGSGPGESDPICGLESEDFSCNRIDQTESCYDSEDRATTKAERYFEIGHNNEHENDSEAPQDECWIYYHGGISAVEGGTHGRNFTHELADKDFKGWYDVSTGKISVVFPSHWTRKLPGDPTPDDIPQMVYGALQRQFPDNTGMVTF